MGLLLWFMKQQKKLGGAILYRSRQRHVNQGSLECTGVIGVTGTNHPRN